MSDVRGLFLKWAAFFVLTLCASPLSTLPAEARTWESASPSVPVDDPVYETLDIFISHGLIADAIVGQRPWTRSEISRLLGQAAERLSRAIDPSPPQKSGSRLRPKTKDFLEALLRRHQDAYAETPRLKSVAVSINPLERASFDTTLLESAPRPYFGSDLLASLNPLAQNLGGRHITDGFQSALETSHHIGFAPYASIFVKPRLQLQWANGQASKEYALFLQEGYATFAFFNTQIDVGRKPMNWGQSRLGGLMFSNNARPIDGVQLTNPEPWHVKHVGHFKYSFFFGSLGPDVIYPYAQISGGKIGYKPFSFLEFDVARAIIFGGNGSPSASAWEIFSEFFGARQQREFNLGGGPNLSNSISGIEWRATLPFLRGLVLYNEIYFDDFVLEKLFESFNNDAAKVVGLYLPRLDDMGRFSLRLEGKLTPDIMYKHSFWLSGWSLNNFILGDPLGPDAQALEAQFTARLPEKKITLSNTLSLEKFKNAPAASEIRVRNILGGTYDITDRWNGALGLGFESVQNHNSIAGDSAFNFLVQGKITYDAKGKWVVHGHETDRLKEF